MEAGGGVGSLAGRVGLKWPSLYKILSKNGNPTLAMCRRFWSPGACTFPSLWTKRTERTLRLSCSLSAGGEGRGEVGFSSPKQMGANGTTVALTRVSAGLIRPLAPDEMHHARPFDRAVH